jgi:predicted transcriptional regulator
VTRRERITLIGVVLDEIARAHGEAGELRLTRVAMRANLPYDRFTILLHDLQAKGLVGSSPPYDLTPEGLDILRKYKGLQEALHAVGFAEAPGPPDDARPVSNGGESPP